MRPFNQQDTIHITESLSHHLSVEQLEACNIIGIYAPKQESEENRITDYTTLFYHITETITKLEGLKTAENESSFNQIDGITNAVALQAFTYFTALLSSEYNNIYPPESKIVSESGFAEYLGNLKLGYAQTRLMRPIKNTKLDKSGFERIMLTLHPTNPIGEIYFRNIKQGLSSPHLYENYPFAETMLFEFLDIYKQRNADNTVPLSKNLLDRNKEDALGNEKDYYSYVDFLEIYFDLIDNIPPIDPKLVLTIRKAELIEKYGSSMPLADKIQAFNVESWDVLAQITKEQLILSSLEVYTPEGLIHAFAGLDGEAGIAVAEKYIGLIVRAFGKDDSKIRNTIGWMLDGLHRYGRSKEKVEELVDGLIYKSPYNLRPIIRKEIGSRLPKLLRMQLLNPQIVPDAIMDSDLNLLFESAIADFKHSFLYTKKLSKLLSSSPFAQKMKILNTLNEEKISQGIPSIVGIDIHEILWLEIESLETRELLELLKNDINTLDKNLLTTISKILRNEKIYPSRSVLVKPKEGQPFGYSADTTYKYIASLIVGSKFYEKHGASSLSKICKEIRKSNKSLAETLVTVAKDRGFDIA